MRKYVEQIFEHNFHDLLFAVCCVCDCDWAAAGFQYRVGGSTDAMHEKDTSNTSIAMKFGLRLSFRGS